MRRVRYRKIIYVDGIREEIIGEGLFQGWGLDFESFLLSNIETGHGNLSTAIIKTEDGKVINVPVENIQFIDKVSE